MKTAQQIAFIKLNKRYKPDLIDAIGIIVPVMIGLIAITGLAVVYFKNAITLMPFLAGEIGSITLTIYGAVKFLATLKFKVIQTHVSMEENKAKIIQYLRSKNMEILESSSDKSILATYLNHRSFLFGQREMIIICDNNLVLLNIRSVTGRGIFTSMKQIKYFQKDIDHFINQLPAH